MNPGKPTEGWDQIMSLPRRLRLIGPDELAIEPAAELDSLRYARTHEGPMRLPANQEIVLDDRIGGKSFELSARIDPKVFELNVLRSPGGEEVTRISFFKERGFRIRDPKLGAPIMSLVSLDTSHSSILPDVRFRAPETAPLQFADGEMLNLEVYVDRSIVEVFVNGRQCVAARVYPGREDSTGVSVVARGQDATIESLDAWKLNSIYECKSAIQLRAQHPFVRTALHWEIEVYCRSSTHLRYLRRTAFENRVELPIASSYLSRRRIRR